MPGYWKKMDQELKHLHPKLVIWKGPLLHNNPRLHVLQVTEIELGNKMLLHWAYKTSFWLNSIFSKKERSSTTKLKRYLQRIYLFFVSNIFILLLTINKWKWAKEISILRISLYEYIWSKVEQNGVKMWPQSTKSRNSPGPDMFVRFTDNKSNCIVVKYNQRDLKRPISQWWEDKIVKRFRPIWIRRKWKKK